jgi:hypothetical protein
MANRQSIGPPLSTRRCAGKRAGQAKEKIAMKASKRAAVASLAGLILLGPSAGGGLAAEQTNSQPERSDSAVTAPVYKPPLRGAPGGRVGGGTRGGPGSTFVLSVLVPDHTGLTLKEQPSLFWFISSDTSLPVELAIIDPNATEPLLETRIAGPVKRGVHRVRLADYSVRLATGLAYQWSVAVIPDSARRSRDILASGSIERVEPAGELGPKLAGAVKGDLAARYAEAGIWYDALEAVSDQVESSPGDTTSQRYRAALLKQVGLPEIAE